MTSATTERCFGEDGSDVLEDTTERLSVVIPVYQSESTIGQLVDSLVSDLGASHGSLEIVLVNDGSTDRSHMAAVEAQHRHSCVKYIRLARNFGEHNAVMCGLKQATGDAVAIIDDDFQNPVSQIPVMAEKLSQGYDVVYSAYAKKHHSPLRNLGSRFNGLVANRLMDVPEGVYLSSFKVMNAFLVEVVTAYDGPFPYIDGLIMRSTNSIGTQVVEHAPRAEGESNYTFRRLIRLWLNMLTGFSILPLRVASMAGVGMSVTAFLMTIFFVTSALVGGIFDSRNIPPGWASLIVSMTLFAGLQLMVLGTVGEYLGRVWLTQTRAPQYIIRDAYGVKCELLPKGTQQS